MQADSAQGALEAWVLRSWSSDAAELPAFPRMASRLVDALERPNVETAVVEEIISQDGSITSQVIRVANSVIYGAACGAQDLHQAIMRIGFKETASVAMQAACRTLFAIEDRSELSCFPVLWPKLWQSSLVCAYGARLLSRELKMADPGRVFLSAMFRDIGSLLILKLLSAGLVRGKLRGTPTDPQVALLFGSLRADLGAKYLRTNRMPNYVVEVAERHQALDVPFAHDTIHIHLVRLADGLCEQIGAAPFGDSDCGLGPAALESAAALGVEEEQLEYFLLQFEGIREQLSELM